MKIKLTTDIGTLRSNCIKYNLCTKMYCEEYDTMLNEFHSKEFVISDDNPTAIKEYTTLIEKTAKAIYYHSSDKALGDWDMTIQSIENLLINNCTMRWVE